MKTHVHENKNASSKIISSQCVGAPKRDRSRLSNLTVRKIYYLPSKLDFFVTTGLPFVLGRLEELSLGGVEEFSNKNKKVIL